MIEQNQGDCAEVRTVMRGFLIGIAMVVAIAVIGGIVVATLGIEHLIMTSRA